MTNETTVVSTEGAPAPVENAAPAPADEGKALDPVKSDTPADAADAAQPEGEKKRNKVPASQRINELTRDKYELKSQNQELQKRLEALEARTQPQEPVKPRLADFDSDTAYEAAYEQYQQKKAEHDTAKRTTQETEKQRSDRIQEEAVKNFRNFEQKSKEQENLFEGYWDKLKDPVFSTVINQYDPEIVSLIHSSENGPALAFHLATNLDEAERIAELSPAKAARELALLESRLELPKPKTVSNAPDPIKPVQAKSTKEVDIYDPNISDEEFKAAYRKRRAAKRGRV